MILTYYYQNQIKRVIIPIIIMFCYLNASAQSGYSPYKIGDSDNSTINVNHPFGTKVQNVKRAAGSLLIIDSEEPTNSKSVNKIRTVCSFGLINNAKQLKNPYALIANHCLFDGKTSVFNGKEIEGYMTFDYEMSDAILRGNKDEDIAISRIYKVKYKVKMYSYKYDLSLLELIEYDTMLLEHAYLAGWDNSLKTGNINNMFSHPFGDHKKIYKSDPTKEMLRYHNAVDTEHPRSMTGYLSTVFYEPEKIQGGCCGSIAITKDNLIGGVFSGNRGFPLITQISNAWYELSNNDSTNLMTFLDPDNTWLNQIPGGYLNDLIEIEGEENFTLKLEPFGSEGSTIETNVANLYMKGLLLYDFVNYQRNILDSEKYPIWTDIHGIHVQDIESMGDNSVILSVWYLDGLEERLLYGSSVNNTSPLMEPSELGFRGQAWNCDSPPINFPPCNRIKNPSDELGSESEGMSTETRPDYLRAINFNNESEIARILDSELPIKIKLQNIGSTPVVIKAIRYPGDVPKNALQLFKPNEVKEKFKSYKYHESRFKGDDEFHIKSIVVTQDSYEKSIKTSNNGGYLNLVNPNYKIGSLKLSTPDISYNMGMKINLNNPNSLNYSYKVWIDYDKAKDESNFYNFDDNAPVSELIASGVGTGHEIIINKDDITLPTAQEIGLPTDETYETKMRITVVEGLASPAQDLVDNNTFGEVEDYLIGFVDPTCENEKPVAYNTYAEDKLAYCGSGGYKKNKEALSSRLEIASEPSDGSITFNTGKIENIPYATAWGPHYAFYGRKQNLTNWLPIQGSETLRVNAVPEVNESEEVAVNSNFLKNHQLQMDIYYPKPKNGADQQALPVVIWMHGGGFMIHDKPEQSEKVCQWLASKGYIVATVDYRLGINNTNGELAKRAMIRAWQDMKAAVKYWRFNSRRFYVDSDGNDVDLYVDFNKIYGLGWDAGAITVLNNMYLTDDIYQAEQAEGKTLRVADANFQFSLDNTKIQHIVDEAKELYNFEIDLDDEENISNYINNSNLSLLDKNNINSLINLNSLYLLYDNITGKSNYSTFSIDDYPTYPCIGGHNNCNSNFTANAQYEELINNLDGRVDKAFAFSGAMFHDWTLKSELVRPVMSVHHQNDMVIKYNIDTPFGNNYLTEFNDLYDVSYESNFLFTVSGGGNLKAWGNYLNSINFELTTLSGSDKGGSNNHTVFQKFGSLDSDNQIEDQLMYFVDAFFIKNTGTNSAPEPSFCQETTITRPDYLEYQAYAEPNIMPYCDYVAEKVILADSYQETSPGSLTFEVGKVEDIPYATTWAPHYGFYGKYRSEINYLWNTSGAYDLTYSEVLLPAMNESSQIGGNLDFIKNGELLMDVYYPKVKGSITSSIDLNEELPVIIWAFGGGFIKHDKPEMSENICNWLASKGYIVAKIDYRLGLNITDGELSKRAATKALQDIKAAIQYWRHTDSDDNTPNGFYKNGDHIWKVDKDKIYGLGWSAGGITVLNNLYLTDSAYNAEVGIGNYLESSGGSYNFSVSQTSLLQSNQAALSFYDYVAGSPYPTSVPIPASWTELGQTVMVSIALWNLPAQQKSVLQNLIFLNNINTLINSNNSLDYNTYSLADYPSVPRILDNQNGLDNLPTESVTKLQNINLNNYDSRFDKGISFSGGISKLPWMSNETNRPISSIYHIDDKIIDKETEVPFNNLYNVNANQNIYNTIFQNDLSKPLPPLNGGKAMYDYASSNGFTNFHRIDLSGSDKGGITTDLTGLLDTKHEPMVLFNATNLEKDKVEPKIMYYVDAFFMKDWGTTAPKSAPSSGRGSNTNLVTEPLDPPDFSIYPNPAIDKLNILVEVRQEGPLQIHIYDMSGRQVYTINRPKINQGHQLITLPVENLSAGNYIVKIRAGDVLRSEQILIK